MCILHQIPSETKIRRELKKILFGKTLFCPNCGSKSVKRYGKRYRCRSCRRPFSLTSVTWLKGMKIPLKTFWLILWCWCNKTPLDQTVKISGVSRVTIIRWFDKFREHLPQDKLSNVRLSGIVQMDEAYRGKKNKKYAIVGAKERRGQDSSKKRKMALEFIPKPSVDRKDAITFISQHIEPKSHLHTDGAAIYKKIDNWWEVEHQYERHNRWEFSLTSEIEGLWGNFTTFVSRMYHHLTADKAPEYIREFTARSMFPEWFQNPQSFLKTSLKPLECSVKRLRKTEMIFCPIFPEQIKLTSVPY